MFLLVCKIKQSSGNPFTPRTLSLTDPGSIIVYQYQWLNDWKTDDLVETWFDPCWLGYFFKHGGWKICKICKSCQIHKNLQRIHNMQNEKYAFVGKYATWGGSETHTILNTIDVFLLICGIFYHHWICDILNNFHLLSLQSVWVMCVKEVTYRERLQGFFKLLIWLKGSLSNYC